MSQAIGLHVMGKILQKIHIFKYEKLRQKHTNKKQKIFLTESQKYHTNKNFVIFNSSWLSFWQNVKTLKWMTNFVNSDWFPFDLIVKTLKEGHTGYFTRR